MFESTLRAYLRATRLELQGRQLFLHVCELLLQRRHLVLDGLKLQLLLSESSIAGVQRGLCTRATERCVCVCVDTKQRQLVNKLKSKICMWPLTPAACCASFELATVPIMSVAPVMTAGVMNST